MRTILLAAGFAALSSVVTADELTIDRMVGSPSLDGPKVAGLKISPDGERVTFLKGKDEDFRVQDLWEFHIASGETRLLVDSSDLLGGEDEVLSEVEKARRERQRITASGIVDYHYSKDGKSLLFPLGGDLYVLPIGGTVKRLTETEAFETDAKFSPEATYVSFIRDQNLFIVNVDTGAETQLTSDGGGTILNGMAEFVAQEEMDRDTGYWWAPDETRIAFTRVDESPVKLVNRYELSADGGVTTIEQRYPFAGTDNVLIELGVVEIESGDMDWIDLGEEKDIYLARVNWLPDSRHVAFQRQNRAQSKLDLVFADVEKGTQSTILTETSDSWLTLHHNLTFLKDSDRFVWSSERSGFRHLYLYDLEGNDLGALTSGQWVVGKLEHVDEKAGTVYFSGFKDTPIENHLYAAPLDPAPDKVTRLTAESGWHGVDVGKDGSVFVDSFSGPDLPPRVALKSMDGEILTWIEDNPLDETHPYAPFVEGHGGTVFGTIKAEDGADLHYMMIRPADFDPEKTYPAVVNVYGGPGVQRVRKAWGIDFDQILVRNGYVVLKLDNRGSSNRGKAFEKVIHHNMGDREVVDQVAAAEFLKGQGFVDPDRIGVYGWSYGGFMTIQLLSKAPEIFKAGLSVAPVTDWRLYDTHYTERFLGDPNVGDAYDKSSVFPYVDGIRSGTLRLVHGMADDNVFFDNTVKLMSQLQESGVSFELMTYPGKRHGIRGEKARGHLWHDALKFFDSRLKAD